VRGLGADFTAHAERAWDAVADGVPDRAVVVAAHQLLQRLARVTLPVVALAAIGRQYLTAAGMHSKAELPIARVKISAFPAR
jgi:enoyl-CoA hydratase/carnithine racemase